MGVVAPNAIGLDAFRIALCQGRSGLAFVPQMKELDFGCHVAGIPPLSEESTESYLGPLMRTTNSTMRYAAVAAIDCWRDSGLSMPPSDSAVDWNTAAIIGSSLAGMETAGELVVPETNAGRVRKLGSSAIERVMASCASACVSGILGLGGPTTTNSSACGTGAEAIVNAYWMIREDRIDRVLAGSTEPSSVYAWAGLDSLRVTMRKCNDRPQSAARPLSASAGGLVPSGGAGILMLESLASARSRGARIYAEILGGHSNSGGQRNGGSITAANPEGIVRCVQQSLEVAKVKPSELDYINGHLTGTAGDPKEIRCLSNALDRRLGDMPWINSTKSLIGHGLAASGSMESVATILQLVHGFLHPSLNCEDFHPEISELQPRVPQVSLSAPVRIALKTSFGFGDVNSCVIFRRWDEE